MWSLLVKKKWWKGCKIFSTTCSNLVLLDPIISFYSVHLVFIIHPLQVRTVLFKNSKTCSKELQLAFGTRTLPLYPVYCSFSSRGFASCTVRILYIEPVRLQQWWYWSTFFPALKTQGPTLHGPTKQCCGSGPGFNRAPGSVSGSRRAKMTTKHRKKFFPCSIFGQNPGSGFTWNAGFNESGPIPHGPTRHEDPIGATICTVYN